MKRLVLVAHNVKKDVEEALMNTFRENIDVMYMDAMKMYNYEKEGWYEEVYERMESNLEKLKISDYDEIYFVAIGFIPAVLIAYDVLRNKKVNFTILTFSNEEDVYKEIRWR